MTNVLYRWPEAAKFGRPVTKTKLYQHGAVSSKAKKRLIAEVEEITWAYKLAESTINLPGSSEVPEIQVLVIHAKANDVDDVVLATIDKAIKQPVIFEIATEQGTRMTATVKAGTLSGRYYTTEWMPADRRFPLPPSITLSNLYAALLEPLLPIRIRSGEGLSDLAARLPAAARLAREIATLERKLRTEPQLNRKVELRRTLKAAEAKLADLTDSTIASTITKKN